MDASAASRRMKKAPPDVSSGATLSPKAVGAIGTSLLFLVLVLVRQLGHVLVRVDVANIEAVTP